MKYLPYIAIAGLIAYIALSPTEVETIDNTEYYEDKNKDLEIRLKAKDRIIENRNNTILKQRVEFDSMVRREDKVHIFYANEKRNLIHIPDSTFNEYWSGLINNR